MDAGERKKKRVKLLTFQPNLVKESGQKMTLGEKVIKMMENILSCLPINTKFLKKNCSSKQQDMKKITLPREKEISQINVQVIHLLRGRILWSPGQGFSNLNVHKNHLELVKI